MSKAELTRRDFQQVAMASALMLSFEAQCHVERGEPDKAEPVRQQADLLREVAASAPAWHPRPTGPGLWAIRSKNASSTYRWATMVGDVYELTQAQVDNWEDTARRRSIVAVFGPIPPAPEEINDGHSD